MIDLLHYKRAAGYKYVLTMVDAYSRWGEMKAISEKSAEVVAEALIEMGICNTFGQLKTIVSDQGTEFRGELSAAMKLLKIQNKYTAAYRSEGHGLVERYNQAVSEKLKTIISQEDPEWHRGIPWVKLAHNNSVHQALSEAGERGVGGREI